MTKTAPVLEVALSRGAMRLPLPVLRRLAGRPVVLDGQVLHPETQWMLRLQRIAPGPPGGGPPVAQRGWGGSAGEPGGEGLPIADGGRALRRQPALVGGRQPIGETRDLRVPTAAG